MRNKSHYPENWNDEIRPRILARDGYKCTTCRIKHRVYVFIDDSRKRIVVDKKEHESLKAQGYRTYRIYLQVAHIDHNKENCSDENLTSQCNLCHYKRDKQHKTLMRIGQLVAPMKVS